MNTRYKTTRNEFFKSLPYLIPTLLLFSIFYYYPLALNIYYSFTKWNIISSPRFIGLKNYIDMLKDPLFIKSLTLTLIFVASVVVGSIVLGILLAISVNRQTRLAKISRVIMFLPYVLPDIAAASIWLIMFGPGPSGYINYILSMLGLPTSSWFYDPNLALPMVILYSIWKNVGFSALVIYAGLKSIPKEYIEAARIDGASEWYIYLRIVLPLLRPILIFLVASIVMMSWFAFGSIYILTKGGPGTATMLIGLLIYRQAFEVGNAGYASAIAVFSTLMVIGLLILQLRWYSGVYGKA